MEPQSPSGADKRKAYAVWFCIAFAVDLAMGINAGAGYRPSLVGLAIMLTAMVFFAWSWVKDR